MKILKSKRKDDTVNIEIEVSTEMMQEGIENAFQKLVKEAKIPGFRKGKISKTIFEKTYGTELLIEEAKKETMNKAFIQAVDELNLKIIDYPKNVQINPHQENLTFTFSCDLDVEPLVKLGKYKGLKIKKDETKISDEKVNDTIQAMLKGQSDWLPVDRPSQTEDIIQLKIDAAINQEPYPAWTKPTFTIKIGAGYFGPEFDTQVTGLNKQDKKEFKILYPKDFTQPEVAEKEVSFQIEVLDIKEEKLPQLTDELVKQKWGHASVDEYKEKIRTYLERETQQKAEEKMREELLTEIFKDIKLEIPTPMIDREIENRIKSFSYSLEQKGLNLNQYLENTRQHIDDIKNNLKEVSERSVKMQMVLEAIAEKENITASDEEIEKEIQNWKINGLTTIADLKEKYPHIHLENVTAAIKEKKVWDFLIAENKIV